MTVSSVAVVMDRILSATEQSPIAVFKVGESGLVDAVFAATLYSQAKIAGDDNLIGIYHSGMDRQTVKRELNAAASPAGWLTNLELSASRLNSTRIR